MDAKDEMQLVPRGPRLLKHDHESRPFTEDVALCGPKTYSNRLQARTSETSPFLQITWKASQVLEGFVMKHPVCLSYLI